MITCYCIIAQTCAQLFVNQFCLHSHYGRIDRPTEPFPTSYIRFAMIVSLDWSRALHLILLVGLTFAGGQILIQKFDWTNLAAYACACSVVCQASNAVLKISNGSQLSQEHEKHQKSERKLIKAKKTGNQKHKT